MKRCTKCKEEKPLSAFGNLANAPDGLKYWCKGCCLEDARKYRKRRPEVYREASKRWREANREKAIRSTWRSMVKRQYGLTLEEYNAIVAQGCAICGTPEGKICLDHDHTSGAVRDALCDSCNRGLGMFGDDLERINAAAEYLRKHA